ncbi:MAG: hypothetical protein NC828_04530, partial [Candidatus Omnitrophica bacterium]|nr:hypothetical protein [Candidatus Omnitrophota bacterium]
MRFENKKGIALIAVIIIIIVTAIAVLGIAVFVSNSLSLNVARASMEGAIFASQAGIYAGIYDYLANPSQPYWTKAQNVNVAGNTYYSVGKDANFLLIDADNPQITNSAGTNNLLQRIPLSNINQTQAITVNRMMVEWNFGGRLNRVRLGGVNRTVRASSGQIFTVSPSFTLNAQQSFSESDDNGWRFNTAIPKNG